MQRALWMWPAIIRTVRRGDPGIAALQTASGNCSTRKTVTRLFVAQASRMLARISDRDVTGLRHVPGWGVRKDLGAGVAWRGRTVTPGGGVGVGVGAGDIPVITRPSRFPCVSVNQMLASGPTVIHSGNVEGLGTAG